MDNTLNYLIETNSIEIKSAPPFFTWSSGIQSPIYCDNRRLLSHSEARNEIVKSFVNKIKGIKTDAICGVATAGISWGALVAHELGLPFIYVRAQAKDHGKKNAVEGDLANIKNVIVIEDLISTGKSSLLACKYLLDAGIKPQSVIAIFQYNLASALENFKKESIPFETLSSVQSLLLSDHINNDQKQYLQDFLCS